MAAAVAIGGAVAIPLAAAAPAHADQVRQREQWVLDALDVPAAWHVTRGRDVTVAVIDSGVDPTVSDLTGSVTTGPDLTGVGTPVSNPNWGDHGTWMASLIAGHGHGRGGQDGILGVAPRSRILSIRVITDRTDPGYATYRNEPPSRGQDELARAIKYAVRHHAGVISLSLGYNAPSLAVRSALQFAFSHNVVVVASAGNSGTPQTAPGQGNAPYSFPADYPGVIGVAAVSQSGQPAYFSSDNLSVSVAAPGVNVPAQGRGSKYWLVSGTSPACALTAGVAALIKSRYPHLTASQVRRAITGSSANRPPHGYDDQLGFGTVDAVAALKMAGRLKRQIPASRSAAARAAAAGYFGNGPSGVPALPVPPRGKQKLLILFAVAAAFLLVLIVSIWRFAGGLAYRRAARRAAKKARSRTPAPAATGFAASAAVNVIYPPQAGGGQAGAAAPGAAQLGQGYTAQGAPVPGFPVAGFPGQVYPAQGFAAQGAAGPGVAGPGVAGPGVAGQSSAPAGQPASWPQAQPTAMQQQPHQVSGQPGQLAAGQPTQPGPAGQPTQPGQAGRPTQPGPAGQPTQPGQAQSRPMGQEPPSADGLPAWRGRESITRPSRLPQAPAASSAASASAQPGPGQFPGPTGHADEVLGWDDQPLRPTLGQEYRSWVISESRRAGVGPGQGQPSSSPADQSWSADQPMRSAFAKPTPAEPAEQSSQASPAWRPKDLTPADRYDQPQPGQSGSSAALPSVWERVLPERPTVRRDAQAGQDQASDAAPGAETT